ARKDDDYPARYYEAPWPTEPGKGTLISRVKMNELLDEFYELSGWEKEEGIPTRGKLIELGLDYVAEELSGLGLI
ncbi:aldehyde ferredoxin oxidoreductase C-terminal domain-containing protein, partial [Chloroflexota bacterium]